MRLGRILLSSIVAALLVPATASAAIQARAALAPQPAFLGDVVRAQLTVSAPAAAQAEPSFVPFRVLSSGRSVERSHGQVVTRFTYRLQCLAAVCSPGPGRRLVTLPAVTVRAGAASKAVRWPAAAVEPRVSQAEVANPTASFRRQTAVPAPDWAHAPATIRKALYVVAAVLVLLAVVLLAPLLRRRARRHVAEPLDLALARVREAVGRPPEDRRRALDLLARTLARAGDAERARSASELAWSEPAPEPGRISTLADQVEAAR